VTDHSITTGHLRLLESIPLSVTGTSRLCFHETHDSPLHVMLVKATTKDVFARHCHTDSDEFTTVLEGGLEITLWSDGLQSTPHHIVLGRDFTGDYGALISKGLAHTTRALSENTVYLEIKLGPFNPDALVKL